MKAKSQLIAAYHFFNPYYYEGDYCNPWSDLLADYRAKLGNPNAVFHTTARDAGSFTAWLVNEAAQSAFDQLHDL